MFKRMIAGLLAALLLTGVGARASGPLCVVAEGVAALVDEQGGDLIPNGACDDLFPVVDGALYAAGAAGQYRLYDAEGRPVSDETFAMIWSDGDSLVFRQGELYGAMTAGGEVCVAAEWTQLTPDGQGGYLAQRGDPLDDQPDEIVWLDAAGEAHDTGSYAVGGLGPVRDGRMVFMASDGRYGAVDARGEIAIPAVWRHVGTFENGLAAVTGEAGRGMMDAAGNAVIEPVYAWLERSDAMVAALTSDGNALDVYAPDGRAKRFTLRGVALRAMLAGDDLVVRDAGGTRLYDADGALLYTASADASFAPGTAGRMIVADGAWGEANQRLVDRDGRASPAFQRILPLCEGRYAWLTMPGTEYYSADLEALQKAWNYDGLRYGLMDDAGRVLLPAEYLEIRALSDDRLLLRTEGDVILADADGRAIRTWAASEGEEP